MPPCPNSRRIRYSPNVCPGIGIGRRVEGGAPVTRIVCAGVSGLVLSRHCGHRPAGASAERGIPHPGQTLIVFALIYTSYLRKRAKRLPSSTQDTQEVSAFFVDLRGRGDGVGNFVFKELAVALAQAMDGDFDGGFGHIKALGKFGVRRAARGEDGLEFAEDVKAASGS